MRRETAIARRIALAFAAWAALATAGSSDAAADAPLRQEPVQCWWRTSAGAVYVAQPFTLLLTCSIVESDQQHVVVDQGKLGAGALSLSPFEVFGGGTLTESRSGGQWFFQRQYQVRLVTDTFGEDVLIPPVVVTYQLETEAAAGGRTRGVERRHGLPPLPMRVVSLVPAAADDIREVPIDTFEEVDDAEFAASLYRGAGLLLMGVGAVGLIVALATGFRARGPKTEGAGSLEDRLILRLVARELESVRAARLGTGWTADLVGRTMAAMRIVGSYLVQRPPSIKGLDSHEKAPAGVLVHRDKRGRLTSITSSLTPARFRGLQPDDDAHHIALQDALDAFTRAHYGREELLDAGQLDAGIDVALRALGDLERERAWIARTRAATVARLRSIRVPWFR